MKQPEKSQHVWELSFQGAWATSVAFLEDHRHLAAADRLGRIFLWKLPDEPPVAEGDGETKKGEKPKPADFAPYRSLVGHTNAVSRLAASADGKLLASASLDHSVRLWNPQAAASGQDEVILDAETRENLARRASSAEKDAILNAPGAKVETVEATDVLQGHEEWINALDMTPDGKRLISGDDGCWSIVWDLEKKAEVSRWHGYDRVWVTSAALSPDGKRAFTAEFAANRGSFDRPAAQARFWNANDGSLELDLLKVWLPDVKDEDRGDTYGYAKAWGKFFARGLVCADISPDGKLLAVGQGGETGNAMVHLVDTESGEILRSVAKHRYGVCDAQFSHDGQYVVSVGRDTTVQISRVDNGKLVNTLGTSRGGQFKDWLHGVAISPDDQWIAAADIAGLVQVWRLGE